MKTVLLIESDNDLVAEMTSTINQIDPKIKCYVVSSLTNFQGWIKQKIEEKRRIEELLTGIPTEVPATEALDPAPKQELPEAEELVLVVLRLEALGHRFIPLLKKTRDFLIRRGLCNEQNPASFVLTAFPGDENKLRACRSEIITNLIMLPFDKAILLQTLANALKGEAPLSSDHLYDQKTSISIEMLKTITFESLRDHGFSTHNNRRIGIGQIAKYYAPIFTSNERMGVYGRCIESKSHPEFPEQFLSDFTFFGPLPEQLNSIRKFIRSGPLLDPGAQKSKVGRFSSSKKDQTIQLAIVDPDENFVSDITEMLHRNFTNLRIYQYPSYAAFMNELDPKLALSDKEKKEIKANHLQKLVRLCLNKNDLAIMRIDPALGEEESLLGYTTKDVLKSPAWLLKQVAAVDLPKFKKLLNALSHQKIHKETIRFVNKTNDYSVLEIQTLPIDAQQPKFLFLEIKELIAQEREKFLLLNRQFQGDLHALLIEYRYLHPNTDDRCKELLATLINTGASKGGDFPLFLLAPKKEETHPEHFKFPEIHDLFLKPLDRRYFLQRIAIALPSLAADDVRDGMESTQLRFIGKVAKEIKLEQISETGLIMRYYRAIKIGKYRAFYLPRDKEKQIPEIVGRCSYTESVPNKDGSKNLEEYDCHFTFFGLTDYYYKHIRNWIREYYISEKIKGE